MQTRWRHHHSLTGILAVLLGILLVGCEAKHQDEAATTPGSDRAASGQPVPGGMVVIAFPTEPDVLNPLITTSSYTRQILSLLYDPAMEMGEDLSWYPMIASGFTLAPDYLSLTYRLKRWVWADGVPTTAYDLVQTFRLLKDPRVASPLAGHYAAVVGAVALDSFTIRYDLDRILPDPVSRTVTPILPGHLVADLDPAEIHTWPLNFAPLSSGPFILEQWHHNHELVLVPNPLYPGQRPHLARLIFRIIPDESSRVMALESGDVDFVEELPVQAARRFLTEGTVNVHRIKGRLFGHLTWNFRNPLFQDKRVRKAISLAIDRSRFVDGLLGGYAQPAASPLPPALWAHNPAVAPDPYDPEGARRLLASAGWRDSDGNGVLDKDGVKFAFEILTRHGDPVRENGVIVISENLRAVGIAVQPRILEHGTTMRMIHSGDFDAYLGLYQANLYVDPTPLIHSKAIDRYNIGGYANATVDSLLEVALATADHGLAKPTWDRLQEIVAEDLPMAFLYYPETLIGASKRLRNVQPHILSPFNNISEWWIDPADRKYLSPED